MAARELKTSSAIRRTAAEVVKYRVMMRVAPAVAGLLTAVLTIVYVVSLLYSHYGAFTVKVNGLTNTKYALTLSETPEFNTTTVFLNSKAAEEINNIEGSTLPKNLHQINGEHNGQNYVAYTFWCKNVGSETVTVRYRLYIANETLGIADAIRVRLYASDVIKDGGLTAYLAGEEERCNDYVDYAKTRTDGTGPEPGTREFYNEDIIVQNDVNDLARNDMLKFTVVIWLEGPDPECVNSILGGEFKVDMNIEIIGLEDTDLQDL